VVVVAGVPGGEGGFDRSGLRARRGGQVGCRHGADGGQQVVRVDAGLGAAAGGGAGQRGAQVPDLDGGQQRVGVRAGQPDQGVDRGGGGGGQERAGPLKGDRLGGVHVELAERGGGGGREGVAVRAQPAQRLGQLRAGARVAEVGGLDLDEGPAA